MQPARDTHEAMTVAPGEKSTSVTDATLPWGAIITAVAFAIAAACGVIVYYAHRAISNCLNSDGFDFKDELRHQQGEKAGSAATCDAAEGDVERAQGSPRPGVVAVAAE